MVPWAVIPALREGRAIGDVVAAALNGRCHGVVVVDGGSRDGTVAAAQAAGAQVVGEMRPGYGRAVMTGIDVARAAGADAFAIFDGNGTIAGDDVDRVIDLLSGGTQLVVGCRASDQLRLLQRLGNRFAVGLIARAYGVRYRDVGSLRAITAEALDALQLDEMGHGWPLQLQLRAAARGLHVRQLPICVRTRRSRSKVSGTVRGTARASMAFLRVLATEMAQ